MGLRADFSERAIARMLNTGAIQAASLSLVCIVICYQDLLSRSVTEIVILLLGYWDRDLFGIVVFIVGEIVGEIIGELADWKIG